MTEPVVVHWEATPNPATLKFIFNYKLVDTPQDFQNAQEAERSPLARKIFGYPWTSSVFIGEDFVTITKQDWVDWEVLSEPLAGLLKEHLDLGEPIMSAGGWAAAPGDSEIHHDDSTEVRIIKEVINREIRPAVAMDGGDIVFAKYENQRVYLHMRGSCAGCPSSTETLKLGIETRLKEAVPEIEEVVAL